MNARHHRIEPGLISPSWKSLASAPRIEPYDVAGGRSRPSRWTKRRFAVSSKRRLPESDVSLSCLACLQEKESGQEALLARVQRIEHLLEGTVAERNSLREQLTKKTRAEERARASIQPHANCSPEQCKSTCFMRKMDGDGHDSPGGQPTPCPERQETHEASRRISHPSRYSAVPS